MTGTGTGTPDPLEQALERAFAAELAQIEDPTLNQRVLEQIRRAQRLRAVATAVVTTLGLALFAVVGLPAIAELASLLSVPQGLVERFGDLIPAPSAVLEPAAPGEPSGLPTGVAAMGLLILLAPWLWAAVDDTV